MLGVGEVLGAEAAADVGRDEAYIRGGDAQRARDVIAVDVDVLAGDVQRVAAALGVEPSDGAARLHRADDDAMIVELEGDDMCGLGEGGVGAGGIAGMPVDADIAGHLVGDDRRPRRPGCRARRDGGQRLVVDRDQLGRVERLGMGLGDDERHRFAGKPHLAVGDQRLGRESERLAGLHVGFGIGAQRPQPIARRVGRRQDGQHARRAPGGVDVDGVDPGMRMRRAQDDGVRQSLETQVVEIGAAAGNEARILPPPGRIADRRSRHVLSFSAFSACRFSSHQSLACSRQ